MQITPLNEALGDDAEVYRWRPKVDKKGVEVDVYLLFTVAFGQTALTAIDLQAIVNEASAIVMTFHAINVGWPTPGSSASL